MTDEQIALAKRAVACKGWRWMPGMAVLSRLGGCRVAAASSALSFVGSYRREVKSRPYASSGWAYLEHTQGGVAGFEDTMPIPDLTDPATLGCLLALVREAYAVPFLQVSVSISLEHGYRFECNPNHRGQWVDSEAAALVHALEAAP